MFCIYNNVWYRYQLRKLLMMVKSPKPPQRIEKKKTRMEKTRIAEQQSRSRAACVQESGMLVTVTSVFDKQGPRAGSGSSRTAALTMFFEDVNERFRWKNS